MIFDGWGIEQLVLEHVSKNLSPGERGRLGNAILDRTTSRSDIEALGPLVEAGEDAHLKTLTFVLSEVGLLSIHAMGWLDDLLEHRSDWIRHHAVVAVQNSGSLEHPLTSAAAVRKLYDIRAVRLAAVRLVANGSLPQIATTADLLPEPINASIQWLISGSIDGVDVRLRSSDVGVAIVGLARLHRSGVNAKLEESMSCREELSEAERWLNRAPIPPKS